MSGQAGRGGGGQEEEQTPGAEQKTERHPEETQEDSGNPVKGHGQPGVLYTGKNKWPTVCL